MSIGRLFNFCMVVATLIVVLVAGQSLVREAADYRARNRAIDAGYALEAMLDVIGRLAAERPHTFRLLAKPAAATSNDTGLMLQRRAETVTAMAVLRSKIAVLDDIQDIKSEARVGAVKATIDVIETEVAATHSAVDAGIAQPNAERNPALSRDYGAAQVRQHELFIPLLNALQARIAMGSPNAAFIVQIARYASDMRDLGGVQPSLITPAVAEGRPPIAQELQAIERVQGEINRLRIQIDAGIAYVGSPPALTEAWRAALAGAFGPSRRMVDMFFKPGAFDGSYAITVAESNSVVSRELASLQNLRDAATRDAIAMATDTRNQVWNRVVAASSELLLVVAAVCGLAFWFRRKVVIPLLGLATKIEGLAGGDRDIVIDMTERRDEVGGLARATKVFHAALIEREKLAAELQTEMAARAELQDQLVRAKKMEAIGTMAGGVAHELNNLLQPILMLGELLVDQFAEDDQASRDDMAVIIDHAERARHIVGSIVTFARKGSSDIGALDVAQEMRAVDAMLRGLVPASVRIEKLISPEACLVMANRTELMQVVTNLVINASHAMNESGSVQIALAHKALDDSEAAELHVKPGDYADLSVTDTGSGIEPGLLDRIFEPFFTTKPAGQGTGLGLSVVYGIVRAWKGAMRVQSEVGHGTTFSVLVPILPS